jgi:hypothetical protein
LEVRREDLALIHCGISTYLDVNCLRVWHCEGILFYERGWLSILIRTVSSLLIRQLLPLLLLFILDILAFLGQFVPHLHFSLSKRCLIVIITVIESEHVDWFFHWMLWWLIFHILSIWWLLLCYWISMLTAVISNDNVSLLTGTSFLLDVCARTLY